MVAPIPHTPHPKATTFRSSMPPPFFPFLASLLLLLLPPSSPAPSFPFPHPLSHSLPSQEKSNLLLDPWMPIHDALAYEASEKQPTSHSSITDALQQYGLPIGLLPAHAVESFSISSDGKFEIHLGSTCYAKFDYKVFYAKKITGKISYGAISNLSGIEAQEFFFWVSVTGIHVDNPSSGYIYFEIGIITKQLSLSLFDEVPDCKSGLRAALE